MSPYAGIFTLTIFSAGFLIFMLFISRFFGPRNKTVTKQLPFECGSVSVGNIKDQRFNIRFYLVAVVFIVFDIDIIFMYPWAVNLKALGWTGFFAMLTFVSILFSGLVYIWRKGVFNWND